MACHITYELQELSNRLSTTKFLFILIHMVIPWWTGSSENNIVIGRIQV
jgi:hypothetical protein